MLICLPSFSTQYSLWSKCTIYVTILVLVLTGISSFSLLVKHENIEDAQSPGCLLIHYIIQGVHRCYNLIYSNIQINTKPKSTLRTLLFALLLIIDALG